MPWDRLIKKIAAHDPKAGPQGGRPAYPMEIMLRIYCLQNGSGDADLSREEAGYKNEMLGRFAGVKREGIPEETSQLHFRHGLERPGLCEARFEGVKAPLYSKGLGQKPGSIVDAPMIHAPASTKHQRGQRDPEMQARRKGQPVYFGMKSPRGVDAYSGLVHPVLGTAAPIRDVTVADSWLQAQAQTVHADAGYQGVAKWPEHHPRPVDGQGSRHRIWGLPGQAAAMLRAHRLKERAKAKIRAQVEYVFRTLKCPFGFT